MSKTNNFQPGKVSIIGNARNEGDFVKQTLDFIVQHTEYPDYEIILVDDGSTDNSFKSINPQDYKIPVKIITNKKSLGFAKSRNKGAKEADGEYLVFIDCHIFPSANWLEELVKAVNFPEGGMSVVKIMGLKDTDYVEEGKIHNYIFNDFSLATAWVLIEKNDVYEVGLACGCSYLIRHEIFNKLHGYTEEFLRVGREDTELCLKNCLLGYKIYSSPKAFVRHHFKETWGEGSKIRYPILHNTLCFAYLHFSQENFKKVLNTVKNQQYYAQALLDIFNNPNLPKLKKYYQSIFKHNDLWYFEKFKDYFQVLNTNYQTIFSTTLSNISNQLINGLIENKQLIAILDNNEEILDFKKESSLNNEDIIAFIKGKLKVN